MGCRSPGRQWPIPPSLLAGLRPWSVGTSHEGPFISVFPPGHPGIIPHSTQVLFCPRLGGEVIERGQEVAGFLAGGGRLLGHLHPVVAQLETIAESLGLEIAGAPRDPCQRLSQDRAEELMEWGPPCLCLGHRKSGSLYIPQPVPCFPESQGGGTQANQMAGRKDSDCSQHSRRPSYASAAPACGGRKLLDFVPCQGPLGGRGGLASGLTLWLPMVPPHGTPKCSHT